MESGWILAMLLMISGAEAVDNRSSPSPVNFYRDGIETGWWYVDTEWFRFVPTKLEHYEHLPRGPESRVWRDFEPMIIPVVPFVISRTIVVSGCSWPRIRAIQAAFEEANAVINVATSRIKQLVDFVERNPTDVPNMTPFDRYLASTYEQYVAFADRHLLRFHREPGKVVDRARATLESLARLEHVLATLQQVSRRMHGQGSKNAGSFFEITCGDDWIEAHWDEWGQTSFYKDSRRTTALTRGNHPAWMYLGRDERYFDKLDPGDSPTLREKYAKLELEQRVANIIHLPAGQFPSVLKLSERSWDAWSTSFGTDGSARQYPVLTYLRQQAPLNNTWYLPYILEKSLVAVLIQACYSIVMLEIYSFHTHGYPLMLQTPDLNFWVAEQATNIWPNDASLPQDHELDSEDARFLNFNAPFPTINKTQTIWTDLFAGLERVNTSSSFQNPMMQTYLILALYLDYTTWLKVKSNMKLFPDRPPLFAHAYPSVNWISGTFGDDLQRGGYVLLSEKDDWPSSEDSEE